MKVKVFYYAPCGRKFRITKSIISFFGHDLGWVLNAYSRVPSYKWFPIVSYNGKSYHHPVF